MNKSNFLTAVAAVLALTAGGAHAAESSTMEKCEVVDEAGKGLVKAHMGDCKSATSSCSGQNAAGDPNAWVLVPAGECEKINAGDFSGISDDLKGKIEGAS